MVIWKDGMPHIVKEIEDLNELIDGEVFGAIKEFIEEYVDNSDEVDELNRKIDDLESEIYGWEDESADLENALEELKEKYSEYRVAMNALKDFIDVMDDSKMSKDQIYYWDKLQDAVSSL